MHENASRAVHNADKSFRDVVAKMWVRNYTSQPANI